MNDPHVVMLVYKIKHNKSIINYSKAEPFCRDEQGFRLSVAEGVARFELKDHYPTIDEAHKAIADYRHAWKFDAQLQRGPGSFCLCLDRKKSKLIDRKPTPGCKGLRASITAGTPSISANLGPVRAPEYPKPPSDIKLDANIRTMHKRYMGYRCEHEPLGAMAYFCLSMLEAPPIQQSSEQRKPSKKRKAATAKYAIDEWVLSKIGHLSSTKGGKYARKQEGTDQPLSPKQRDFLEQAVKTIIRRAAEREHMPEGNLPTISQSDLPSLENDSDSEPIQRSSK